MKILTIDIGTGTQDIYLYKSNVDLENGFKLVVPSPTMRLRGQIQAATRKGEAIALSGVTMGGGPCAWAIEEHLKAGVQVFATPAAARTLDDDLDAVRELGVQLVSEDEIEKLPASVNRMEMRDFDFPAIRSAFSEFNVDLDNLDAIAVAVFDHGNAPPNVSDRQFRFDYLAEHLAAEPRITSFAFNAGSVPASMTRLQAVEQSAASLPAPLVLMDTAPAAVLGATFDPHLAGRQQLLICNVGNFHSLAFRLNDGEVEGVFEHHTGLLNQEQLAYLLISLASGHLTHAEVFGTHGHGALLTTTMSMSLNNPDFNVVVTGPRRNMLRGSSLKPHFAVPFGDMMIAGCFGLLAGTAHCLPDLAEPIWASLAGEGGSGKAPWDNE